MRELIEDIQNLLSERGDEDYKSGLDWAHKKENIDTEQNKGKKLFLKDGLKRLETKGGLGKAEYDKNDEPNWDRDYLHPKGSIHNSYPFIRQDRFKDPKDIDFQKESKIRKRLDKMDDYDWMNEKRKKELKNENEFNNTYKEHRNQLLSILRNKIHK